MVTASQTQYGPAFDILIVDNKELTRETVQRILQQEGYTVDTARHGKEGIEKIRANNYGYRLVITELIMPYAGGFEVIKTVKKESRIPVMVLSAVADEDTINESFRLSADDFLKKPFMASELVQRIQRLLIRHAAPVYPKTVTMPLPVPSVVKAAEVLDENQAVEAVVAKRKRSIKAAATANAPKTVVARKAPAVVEVAALKETSKATTGKKVEKTTSSTKNGVKATASKKVTATKGNAAKSAAAKKTAATTKTAVKKAGSATTKSTKKSSATKSKVIIKNSIPLLIRSIPQFAESQLPLKKADSKREELCAIAV